VGPDEFCLGEQPVFDFTTVLAAARLKQFVGPAADVGRRGARDALPLDSPPSALQSTWQFLHCSVHILGYTFKVRANPPSG
jgi:hypothetical protein